MQRTKISRRNGLFHHSILFHLVVEGDATDTEIFCCFVADEAVIEQRVLNNFLLTQSNLSSQGFVFGDQGRGARVFQSEG